MLKKYAVYFVAFLLNNLKNTENVERIILYGSVAKEQETEESDIDIFIEVKKKNKKFEKEIKEIENGFYSSRDASLFKIKGIENVFNVKIGKLKEWRDLYKSIASTGIVLYGPYEAKELPSGTNHQIIIYWSNIGKNRGAFLNKVYGYKIKNKKYPGLLQNYQGKKIGKSCIILPVEYKNEIFKLLREYEVDAQNLEIFI